MSKRAQHGAVSTGGRGAGNGGPTLISETSRTWTAHKRRSVTWASAPPPTPTPPPVSWPGG
jgi:hypothetical protein